ncbi:TIGR00269 family protein [archaeon]|jgi:tRNA-5-methyluridine54 2-sulfurtransferase|nr:TIGR00269 family protein [archaeon]MBT3577664.1 TIGR00269 family protein [archaeon]MBT6820069.1 TIGR00269 family protein [archaeon]MBT7025329.1 TIGR00269 family protein [archaeon]MBT7238404.1 TIGR00269 family protein [archaeon]
MDMEKKIAETIKKYKLIKKKDKVVVALSGGKDSTSVLYILNKLGYNVEGLMIDLYLGEWSEIHKRNMKKFCDGIGVPLMIVDLKKELGQGICFIKAVLKQKKGLTGCSVCGTVKRWILNKWARKLKGDVLVTGHNLDDETQNVLMNFLKGNVILGANSSPATGGEINKDSNGNHGKFVQRVKPLFFVPEGEIRKYAEAKKFEIMYERCPCAFGTYRVDTRAWMDSLGLTDGAKKKIVENFQKIIPKLKKQQNRELVICEGCGEPSTGKICNACKIFECL